MMTPDSVRNEEMIVVGVIHLNLIGLCKARDPTEAKEGRQDEEADAKIIFRDVPCKEDADVVCVEILKVIYFLFV